jgi:hypothetical protein
VAILTNLVLMVAVAAVVIGTTDHASRDIVGATPGPLSCGFYLFTEGLTLTAPLAMLCYAMVSVAGIRAARRTDDRTRQGVRLVVATGSLVASTVALFGSLHYSFTELVPGAGIPGPYQAVPVVAAIAVIAAAVAALVLRWRRRASWDAMGGVLFD